jgi:hypothetical protein
MIYRGQVKNGVIQLKESVALPEGADATCRARIDRSIRAEEMAASRTPPRD